MTRTGLLSSGPILQAFRQQRRLPAIDALDEPRHARPRQFSSQIIARNEFSHSQGQKRRSSRLSRASFCAHHERGSFASMTGRTCDR